MPAATRKAPTSHALTRHQDLLGNQGSGPPDRSPPIHAAPRQDCTTRSIGSRTCPILFSPAVRPAQVFTQVRPPQRPITRSGAPLKYPPLPPIANPPPFFPRFARVTFWIRPRAAIPRCHSFA